MRISLTTILLFVTLNSFGQVSLRQDSSRRSLDSLFERLISLAKSIRHKDADIPTPSEGYNYKIIHFGSDTSAVYFFDTSGVLLFRNLNRYNQQGCRWWEVNEIYTASGKLSYWEAWQWSCLKPEEKNDPEVKYFDALLYEKERLTYDSLGRIKEWVWWYAPLGGIRKYTYAYDSSNNQTYQLTKQDEGQFWE